MPVLYPICYINYIGVGLIKSSWRSNQVYAVGEAEKLLYTQVYFHGGNPAMLLLNISLLLQL